MHLAIQHFLQQLNSGPACLVTVDSTQGSVPRERGAWMAVFAEGTPLVGTIGGGHLEFEAIVQARELLRLHQSGAAPVVRRWALGPSLGQCCGGVVHLRFECVGAADCAALRERLMPALTSVALFGGGHVGHALARAIAPLPFELRWIDSRDSVFPAHLPLNIECEHSDPVEGAAADLPANSRVLIMSFSHAEDLDIVAACLQRQRVRGDLPFIGLIGSATKRATFSSRLRQRGFTEDEVAHITCPIGIPGITGKEPEVIAASVTAQLLQSVYTDSSN